MCAFVCYQIALLIECLTTHYKGVRALTTINMLVCYPIGLLTESFITHITSVMALITMYAFVIYQIALLTECLITHFKYKGAHHYECICVLLDSSFD